jgi:GntR family transcriptional regulator
MVTFVTEPTGSAAATAYNHLVDALRRGVYAAGSRLPGERELAPRLGVSRSTLRQALNRLADEGLLSRSSQRGWFVAHRTVGEPPSVLQSFTDMALSRGLKPTARVRRQEVRPASFNEAERLHIAPAAPVVVIDRIRAMDGMPICLDETIVVAGRAGALATEDLTDRSLYQALEDTCGIVVVRSSYAVQADAADAQTADLLGLAPAAPILVGHEITYDGDGVPVLLSTTKYRGDAYRFEADLYRPLR